MNFLENFLGEIKDENQPKSKINRKISRKRLYWLAILILAGILLIFLGSGTKEPEISEEVVQGESIAVSAGIYQEEQEIAASLKQILEQISGVGQVEVTVRLNNSHQKQYALNSANSNKTIEESDQSGGSRITREENDSSDILVVQGDQVPVVLAEEGAEIAGVLVVAEGADDPALKRTLFEAVRQALGLEACKIEILAGKGAE